MSRRRSRGVVAIGVLVSIAIHGSMILVWVRGLMG